MEDPTAPAMGATFIVRNTTATLINKGFELNLSFDILKTENTTFTLRANAAMNDQQFDNYSAGLLDSEANPTYRSQNGNLPFTPYVYHYIGVNPQNGNLLFEDINGNPTENPTDADRKLYKNNYFPKYQGGFGFDIEWKGFFATTTFTFVADVSRFDSDLANALDPSNLGTFNVSSDLLNAWTPTNTNTDIPALNAANLAAATNSDRFLVDASYIRLRNAQLGYRLPKSLIQGTFIKDMSIILQGENIYTWTKWRGFDPESSRSSDLYQYPTPRTFTLGFNIKF
jgi:hypothetical protein